MLAGGYKNRPSVSSACPTRRLKEVASGRASGVKTYQLHEYTTKQTPYRIGCGMGQQRPLPGTAIQGSLVDMLLGCKGGGEVAYSGGKREKSVRKGQQQRGLT